MERVLKKGIKNILYSVIVTLLMACSIFPLNTMKVHAAEASPQPQYENITIASGYNYDVIVEQGSTRNATYSYYEIGKKGSDGVEFQFSTVGSSGKGFPDNGIVNCVGSDYSGLTFKMGAYNSANALCIRNKSGMPNSGTLTFDKIGCYQKLYFMVEAGGAGDGCDISAIVNYTDGTQESRSFYLLDHSKILRPSKGIDTHKAAWCSGMWKDNDTGTWSDRHYSMVCEMDVNTTKLVKSITFKTTNDASMGAAIFAVSGKVADIAAPSALTLQTSAQNSSIAYNEIKASWDAVSGAASYRVDVAADEHFTSIVSGYNNKEVSTNSIDISGLDASTTYYVRVRSVNGDGGQSASSTVVNASTGNRVTVCYNNGLYDGFAPYWKVTGGHEDGVVPAGSTLTLPVASTFTNIGYTFAGWTTTKPTAGSTPSTVYLAGTTLTKEQVNSLISQSTNGKITFYAVWNRDTTKFVWNDRLNKLYSSEAISTSNALYSAMTDASLSNGDTIFILQDHNFFTKGINIRKNITIDGGVYYYDATTKQRAFGGVDTAKAVYGDHTRYTLYENEISDPAHAFLTRENSSSVFQNLVFTKGNNYKNDSNGLIWLYAPSTVTLDNVEIYNLGRNPNNAGTALIGCGQNTGNLILKDCYFHDNTSEGGIFVAGNSVTRNPNESGGGDIIVTLKGNTRIINNKTGGIEMNVKIVPPKNVASGANGVYLHIDADFTGKVGVYLPTSNGLIGALCTNREQAIALINNGNVVSDQGYKLVPTPASYNPGVTGYTSAIRVAEDAKLTFDVNGGSGSLPTKAYVDGIETPIVNGVLDAYIGAIVTLPDYSTITKSGYVAEKWNGNASGTGTNYPKDYSLTLNATATTLYVKWKAHAHNWQYSKSGNEIIARCDTAEDCTVTNGKAGIKLTINASDTAYTGTSFGVTASWPVADSTLATPTIKYVGRGGTTYTESTVAPTAAGTYTAKIIIGDVEVTRDFEITKQAGPAAPSSAGLTATAVTMVGVKNGTISGVDSTMEYSTDGGNTWTKVTGSIIAELGAGDVRIRYSETDNTLASDYITVTVPNHVHTYGSEGESKYTCSCGYVNNAMHLEITKEAAKAAIDAAVDGDTATEIVEAANAAKNAIDEATSLTSVSDAELDGIKKIAELKHKNMLEEVKKAAKEEIDKEVGTDASEEAKKAAEAAKAAIDAATTVEEVETVTDTGIKSIEAIKKLDKKIKEAKEAAKAAIDAEAGGDTTPEVVAAVEAAKAAIDAATGLASISDAELDGIAKIAELKHKNKLEEVKRAAKAEIDNEVGTDTSTNVKEAAEAAKAAIDAATTVKEVEAATDNGIKAINMAKTMNAGKIHNTTKPEENFGEASIELNHSEIIEKFELTTEELIRVENGEDIAVKLEVRAEEAKNIEAAEKKEIEKKLESGEEIGQYLDINLFKIVGNDKSKIKNTKGHITIEITIPSELKKVGKDFFIIRVHDGLAEKLELTHVSGDVYSFETDRFSTYAIGYKTLASAESPNTGDTSNILLAMILMLGSMTLALCAYKKRRA